MDLDHFLDHFGSILDGFSLSKTMVKMGPFLGPIFYEKEALKNARGVSAPRCPAASPPTSPPKKASLMYCNFNSDKRSFRHPEGPTHFVR